MARPAACDKVFPARRAQGAFPVIPSAVDPPEGEAGCGEGVALPDERP